MAENEEKVVEEQTETEEEKTVSKTENQEEEESTEKPWYTKIKPWHIVAGILILLVIFVSGNINKKPGNEPQVGSNPVGVAETVKKGDTSFTLEIVNNGNKEVLSSEQNLATVKDYMDEMVSEGKLKYQCQIAVTAVTINEVNGVRSNPKENTYWLVRKNGLLLDKDISRETVEPGAVYTLSLEKIEIPEEKTAEVAEIEEKTEKTE